MLVAFIALTAEILPVATARRLENHSAYTLVPIQLSMGRAIPSAPPPKKRLSAPPAKPRGALTSEERGRLAEAMNRMTPKERKRLSKAWKKMTPEQRNQLAAEVKRNLARSDKAPHGMKRAM